MTARPYDVELVDDDTVVLAPAPAAGSVLDVLRAKTRELAAAHEYDMVVPGRAWAGRLVLRCEPLQASTLTTLRMRLERSKDPERDFALNADVLINACVDVLGRRTRTDELVPLGGDVPMTIGAPLADALGLDGMTTSRQVLRALFSGVPSPELAVMNAAGDYLSWAQGADEDLEVDALGESTPTAGS